MKTIRLLCAMMRGIRLQNLILVLMITGASLLGTVTLSRLNFLYRDYNMINSDSENAYYIANMTFPKPGMLMGDIGEQLVSDLKKCKAVERVYSVIAIQPVLYEGERITVLLYDPFMLEEFPSLRQKKYGFELNPDGFVLIGKEFAKIGHQIHVDCFKNDKGWTTVELKVNSVIPCADVYFSFSSATNDTLDASLLLTEGDAIIGLATDSNMRLFKDNAEQLSGSANVVFKLRDDATTEEKQEAYKVAQGRGVYSSLKEITDATLEDIDNNIRVSLPRPLFLMFISGIAYIGLTALHVIKKEKDISICYLCGAGKRKCLYMIMMMVGTAAIVSAFLNFLVFSLLRNRQMTGDDRLYGFLFESNGVWLLTGYFLITLSVAVITVAFSMKGKSPIDYMRRSV